MQYKMFSFFVGKMNCGRSGQLCNKLGVNRYPIWGVLKPGGAFELHHGKNTNNDITKFVKTSVRATNVWALTAKEILSILQRNSGNLTLIFSIITFSRTRWYWPRENCCRRRSMVFRLVRTVVSTLYTFFVRTSQGVVRIRCVNSPFWYHRLHRSHQVMPSI